MKRNAFAVMWLLFIVSVAASAFWYARLPDAFVSHWNAAGEANGTMSKAAGAFFVPGIMLVFLGLYALIPKIDPLKENLEKFRKDYDLLWLAVLGFFAYLHAMILAWNLGTRFAFGRWLVPAFAALWYVLGIVLGRAHRNWFVGIRTPWTLASDEVWDKTHRFGSKLFKIMAVVSLIGLFLPAQASGLIVLPAIAVAGATIVYSHVVWKRLPKVPSA